MSHKYSKIGGVTGDSEYVYTIDTDRGTLSYKDIDIETGKFGRFGRSVNMFTATKGLTKQASGTGNSNG